MALIHTGIMRKQCWGYLKEAHRQARLLTKCTFKPAGEMGSPLNQSKACVSLHLWHQLPGTKRHAFHQDQPYRASDGLPSLNCPKTKFFSPVRWHSKITGQVVLKLTEDIDFEELKRKIREEKNTNDIAADMSDRIKEIIAERCDAAVAKLNEEDQKKLKVIKLEHNFMYSQGHNILSPDEMANRYWLEALALPSKAQRLKYYVFITKRTMLKMNDKKKEAKKQLADERPKVVPYEHGRIFFRIYESTMTRWENYRLASAMQFGIPLVLDMDYEDHMRPQELKNTAAQLLKVYCENRSDNNSNELPFHLHFTGCGQDNTMFRSMMTEFQTDQLMATVTDKSYLDIFNKDDLVYLSPNARQAMKDFDPNAVYIIGGFNDKATQKPVSYARAKQQGIKCLQLPLDYYLQWNQGSKNLTLDQIMKILLAVKNGKSWEEAFKFVPKRKIRPRDF